MRAINARSFEFVISTTLAGRVGAVGLIHLDLHVSGSRLCCPIAGLHACHSLRHIPCFRNIASSSVGRNWRNHFHKGLSADILEVPVTVTCIWWLEDSIIGLAQASRLSPTPVRNHHSHSHRAAGQAAKRLGCFGKLVSRASLHQSCTFCSPLLFM